MKRRKIWIGLLGMLVISFALFASKDELRRTQYSKSLNIFSTLLREVNMLYVDEVDSEKMVEDGINAMLKELDPYTVYYPEKKLDEFNLMVKGAYAGVGAVISLKGDYVVIREPYKDSPAHKAGLLPGDKILAIDGEEMKGKDVEFVSSRLKGEPRKEITVKIERVGESKPLEKKIIREVVQLPAIPYYGMLTDNIGYIYFTSFTEKSAEEIRKTLLELKGQGMESLVLDLRSNGGGLMDQAVEIANFFLPRGSVVVSTKGKVEQWDKEYAAPRNPLLPEMKLAVLINRHSASAAEIVAGAIQDYDRGVIIGERSFGKGLVQTTRDLVYNTKLKVTTAKYYIPSGRSIQAVDYSHRNPDGSVGVIPDSLIKPYTTKAGRTVYDGGGITPDVKMEPEKIAKVTQELLLNDIFFDFTNLYASTHPTIEAPEVFEVTDAIYGDFIAYLKEQNFEYETASQISLEKLVEMAKAEKYYDQIAGQLERLKTELGHSLERDMELFRDEISEILADQLIQRYYMQEGSIRFNLRSDKDIKKAQELLTDPVMYEKLLKPAAV